MGNNKSLYGIPELDAEIAHRRDLAAKLLKAAAPKISMISVNTVVGSDEAENGPKGPVSVDDYLRIVDPIIDADHLQHQCNSIRYINGLGFVPVLTIIQRKDSDLVEAFLFHIEVDVDDPDYCNGEVTACQEALERANTTVKSLFREHLITSGVRIEKYRYLLGEPENKFAIIDHESYLSLLSIPTDEDIDTLCPQRDFEHTQHGWMIVAACNDHDGEIDNHFIFSDGCEQETTEEEV